MVVLRCSERLRVRAVMATSEAVAITLGITSPPTSARAVLNQNGGEQKSHRLLSEKRVWCMPLLGARLISELRLCGLFPPTNQSNGDANQ